MIILDNAATRDAYKAFRQLGGYYRLAKSSLPPEFQRLHDRLDAVIRGEPDPEEPDERLTSDEIGTTEAALILGCTPCTVRRRAADLDGVQVSGSWVFTRRTVEKYAAARTAA